MENYLESVNKIRNLFELNGSSHLSEEIHQAQLSGFTGSEILLSICSKLLEIKSNDKSSYLIVKEESEKLLEYANSIGLHPN